MSNPHPLHAPTALSRFRAALDGPDALTRLRDGLIGEGVEIDGPFGPKPLVYADYVASGRAHMAVERFVMEHVLPYYANSHTEASFVGAHMTRMRNDARAIIARACGAGPDHAVIFSGSGATSGINRVVTLLGAGGPAAEGRYVRVIVGPYEHHSNILPWRESGAEVVEIPESPMGGPDIAALQAALDGSAECDRVICSLSAVSNVTGIVTDVPTITRMVKRAGAAMVWDYAGGAPYVPIDITPEPDAPIDAIVLSPHKFIGGPGASGVLLLRRDAVVTDRPSWPGGGTVRFVSPRRQDYSAQLENREEAGTPNVIGDIRAALAFLIKDAIGAGHMQDRNTALTARALKACSGNDMLELLGNLEAPRLPIFSFRVRDGRGGYIHQQLVTRMLSDRYGIQARGGCACAGPYVHRLLGISDAQSDALRDSILAGNEMDKPGFTRLNFSVLMSDEKVDYILRSVAELAGEAEELAADYDFDPSHAIFFPRQTTAGAA